ncbi:hypothetical protein QBC33DRAFT_551667 [Phialemonium atrogriseum]|uniref:Uncharacterized protein n=1 Tax=Phialemonium atrogriseum TaxID=1093897 RepID=A0AAJ0BT71_9PEZI|nr:uncharacterized protein QBC33DRAFT_551667 [Phialemonium atrogriseum]KAK1762664.1 hypothetical protein QBC33DRAFT_551667 [Phialemonium atrogriseum]
MAASVDAELAVAISEPRPYIRNPKSWVFNDPDAVTMKGWGEAPVKYTKDDCVAAMRGERAPSEQVDQLPDVMRCSVLRGIRHHHGFATELRTMSCGPEHIRALNARAIMSNEIPDIDKPEHIPYCIWYPDVATEDTYRALVRRYPQMRYHVGRATAVAGYVDLYRELDLLPDLAIAEEARDNAGNSGSREIFDLIVSQPARWRVMDDYARCVALETPLLAKHGLNGDTAVRSLLGLRRRYDGRSHNTSDIRGSHGEFRPDDSDHEELARRYFNITEDWSIDEFSSVRNASCSCGKHDRETPLPDNSDMLALLWNPLPTDLPAGDKDVLILMAAYYGDIDRYERLRRPMLVSQVEELCVRRGIYHNTMFAKWWSLQPDSDHYRYQCAINARAIMNNDLSRITDQTSEYDLPYQIWWPLRAHPETYIELARRKPSMKPAVARALIVADYQEAWDGFDFEPHGELVVEAKASPNPHYLADLERRCTESGLDFERLEIVSQWSQREFAINSYVDDTTTFLRSSISVADFDWLEQGPAPYNSERVNMSEAELFAIVPDEMRPPEGFEAVILGTLYYEYGHKPPAEDAESEAYIPRDPTWRRIGRGGSRGGRGGGNGIPWGNGRWATRGR